MVASTHEPSTINHQPLLTVHGITDMQCMADAWRREGKTIGLVPTMGYFHEGHLSLMRRARVDCDIVVVSLFVNPTQFEPQEDFASYPRNLEGDCHRAEEEKVDAIFAPSSDEIYPKGYVTFVEVEELSRVLCGASRPGHFRGVATVVAKLFNICKPHRAFFGSKDYQQTVVIERMIRDLNFDVELIRCPTVREEDGLAMSSRNAYLSSEERKAAPILYRSLTEARRLVEGGARDARWLGERVGMMIQSEPLAQLDYAEVVDARTLELLDDIAGRVLIAVAAKFANARLIDNLVIHVDE